MMLKVHQNIAKLAQQPMTLNDKPDLDAIVMGEMECGGATATRNLVASPKSSAFVPLFSHLMSKMLVV